MTFQPISFQIARTTDRILYDRLTQALSNAGFQPQEIVLTLLIGGNDLINKESEQKKQIEAVLKQDTIAVRSFSFKDQFTRKRGYSPTARGPRSKRIL